MEKFFTDLFTGADNKTFDLGRVLWALSVCIYLLLCILQVAFLGNFNATEYGVGLGSVLTGGGASLFIKKSTEPVKPDNGN